MVTLDGELVLFDIAAPELKKVGRLKVFTEERGLYAHAAFVGTRVYLRGSSSLVCLDLADK